MHWFAYNAQSWATVRARSQEFSPGMLHVSGIIPLEPSLLFSCVSITKKLGSGCRGEHGTSALWPGFRCPSWHQNCLAEASTLSYLVMSVKNILKIYGCIYLKGRATKRHGEKERSSIFWFTPHISWIGRIGLGWRQQPGTLPRAPMWVERTHALWAIMCYLQVLLVTSWIRSKTRTQTQTLQYKMWALQATFHFRLCVPCSFFSSRVFAMPFPWPQMPFPSYFSFVTIECVLSQYVNKAFWLQEKKKTLP